MNAGYLGARAYVIVIVALASVSCGGGSNSPNSAPNISDTNLAVLEDTPLNGTFSAPDPQGDAVAITVATTPQHGTLTLGPNLNFRYVPEGNFNGQDTFTVTATDARGAAASATMTLTIHPDNDAPAMPEMSVYTIDEDSGDLTGTVHATDAEHDPFTFSVSGGPALTIQSNGDFVYRPPPNIAGLQMFQVRATDSHGAVGVLDLRIVIRPLPDAPIASGDGAKTPPGRPIVIDVLANDLDADLEPLAPEIVTNRTGGTATVNADGTVTFTPDAGYAGTSGFEYRAKDPGGLTSQTVEVNLEVRPVQKLVYATHFMGEQSIIYDELFTLKVLGTISADHRLEYLGVADGGRTLVYGSLSNAIAGEQSWFFADLDGTATATPLVMPTYTPVNGRAQISRDGTALLTPEAVIVGGQATTRIHLVEPYAGTSRVINTAPASPAQSWDFRFIGDDSTVLYESHYPSIGAQNAQLYAVNARQVAAPVLLRPTLPTGDNFAEFTATGDGRYAVFTAYRSLAYGAYAVDLQNPGSDIPVSAAVSGTSLRGVAASPVGHYAAYALDAAAPPAVSSAHLVNLESNQRVDLGPAFAVGTRIMAAPIFSPDGQHVLLSTSNAAGTALYEADIANPSVLRQVSPLLPPTTASVQYTPDSTHIIYTAQTSPTPRALYVIKRSSALNATQLNEDLGTDVTSFVISPDSSTVGYLQQHAPGAAEPKLLHLIDLSTPGKPFVQGGQILILGAAHQPFFFVR